MQRSDHEEKLEAQRKYKELETQNDKLARAIDART